MSASCGARRAAGCDGGSGVGDGDGDRDGSGGSRIAEEDALHSRPLSGSLAAVRDKMSAAVEQLLLVGEMAIVGGVDATALQAYPGLVSRDGVVFFQCPCAGGPRRNMRVLVRKFLASAAACGPAWILVGILNNP